MKQILQNLSNGSTYVVDVPDPAPEQGAVVVRTSRSVVSPGTERMLVEFGQGNLLQKAMQQPDRVKEVLQKARTDGLLSTIKSVTNKLAEPIPLGYSNVGVIEDPGGSSLSVGDRVVSNGPHAECVRVPARLCAKVPDNVDDDSAAFTVIASVALQGTRLAQPTLGEHFVVIGLGLIGLITVQLLRAQGCLVLASDPDESRCKLAEEFGARTTNSVNQAELLPIGQEFSRGRGVDGVIIAASTSSNDPVSVAAKMCRKRARIVLVGVTGLELNRSDFYEKELTFQVSCSYGPGRYDPEYEEKGRDYPVGFVRWTEERNFEAVLDMMASGSLQLESLITRRISLQEAPQIYQDLNSNVLGLLIEYVNGGEVTSSKLTDFHFQPTEPIVLGVLGAGNFARSSLIPSFKHTDVHLGGIVASSGVSAESLRAKFEFSFCSTNENDVVANERINTVAIATRHHLHARQVISALSAGKHVYVEKPLALTLNELTEIESITRKNENLLLMVGFNRRFAPLVRRMKDLLDQVPEPKTFILTMNAGNMPSEHWVHDRTMGGGRIIGEACHYVDLMRYLVGCPISEYSATRVGGPTGAQLDRSSFTLKFLDGSIGTIHYFANGGKVFAKERIEAFAGDGVLQLDNFRTLRGFGWRKFRSKRLLNQNKGHRECVAAFVNCVKYGTSSPIPIGELLEVSKVTVALSEEIS